MASSSRPRERTSERAAQSPEPRASAEGTSTTITLSSRSPEDADPDHSAAFWSPIAGVRAAVDTMFGDLDAETVDAVRMTAGELAENVIKYGEPVDGVTGHISISRTNDAVEIRTVNRMSDSTETADLFERLRRIGEADDLRAQFVDRMTQIIDEPNQHSTALGLLRIAYEGLFKLSCSYANEMMTVVATRSIR